MLWAELNDKFDRYIKQPVGEVLTKNWAFRSYAREDYHLQWSVVRKDGLVVRVRWNDTVTLGDLYRVGPPSDVTTRDLLCCIKALPEFAKTIVWEMNKL